MTKNYLYSSAVLLVSILIPSLSLSAEFANDEEREKASYYNGKKATTETIDIRGLDKRELLLALWDNAKGKYLSEEKFIGSVILPTIAESHPTEKEINGALVSIANGNRIDYFCGRCLKVDLSGEVLKTFLYDRDHGTGTGQRVISELRAKLP